MIYYGETLFGLGPKLTAVQTHLPDLPVARAQPTHKPRKRLVRDKPDALVVPLGINQV
jgi:hypothetical protein